MYSYFITSNSTSKIVLIVLIITILMFFVALLLSLTHPQLPVQAPDDVGDGEAVAAPATAAGYGQVARSLGLSGATAAGGGVMLAAITGVAARSPGGVLDRLATCGVDAIDLVCGWNSKPRTLTPDPDP